MREGQVSEPVKNSFLDLVLPQGIVPATVNYPRRLLMISEMKAGKSSIAAWLSRNRKALWIDYEEEDAGDCLAGHKVSVPGKVRELAEKGVKMKKLDFCFKLWSDLALENPRRYDYVIHDKVDTLEDWAERWATALYKKSTIGGNFGGDSVLELPDGAGYQYLRKRFLEVWNAAIAAAPVSVFMGTVRENRKTDKLGNTMTVEHIDLDGRCRKIAWGQADGPCRLYKNPADGSRWLTFNSGTNNPHVGCRFGHLDGQEIEIARMREPGKPDSLEVFWGRIYPEEERDGVVRLKR
jgi:hypothetical protein